MSLRTRLLLGLLGLVSVGLIASDLITYRFLQSFLMRRLDEQVLASVDPVASRLSVGERRSPPLSQTAVPGGTYGAVVDNSGKVLLSRPFGYEGDDLESLPQPQLTVGDLARREPFTTDAVERGAPGFRVVVRPLSADAGNLVVAVPMNDVVQTLRRLVLIELVTTGAIVAAVGGLALVVVRAGLRPLEDIGRTAGAIAEGDLSRRVDRAEPRTEVGRLGLSLNAMLTQIQTAFEARQASEDRLRRFVADASHELRTPLTSIRGYAECSAGACPTAPTTWPPPCAASRRSRPAWASWSTTCCSWPDSTKAARWSTSPWIWPGLRPTRWPTPGRWSPNG